MDNTTERLIQCFLLVFPNLPPSDVPAASPESLGDWDSLAQIKLLSVICEEFGIDFDFEKFEGGTSFAALLDLVRRFRPSNPPL
jgi:acyl carrier protein